MWMTELLQDVHELQQTLETTLRAQRTEIERKRHDFYALLHDAKNALTGISSCAEVLGTGELAVEQQKEFLCIIGSEIERVIGITHKLAAFTSRKPHTTTVSCLSLQDFFHDLTPVLHRALVSQHIAFHCHLNHPASLRIDRESLTTIILNIVYNARDAMPEGGSLTIKTQIVNDMLHIEFIDTGCGMSPELQARFLEPLVTAGKPHGTGLGMAIVKDLLDEHHGRIEVKSVERQGTTIRILLPCQPID